MTPRVLLAEDDPDIRMVLAYALQHLGGFDVHACTCGDEVLLAVDKFNPDLILLDVMMPNGDGPTTLGKLQHMPAHKDTPVVFLTARGMPDELEWLLNAGATGVILKPFDPQRLHLDLRIYLEHAQSKAAKRGRH